MAYSVLVAETAWPEVPETVKPSKKIREERLEILNKSHILRPSHFLKHSHILRSSHFLKHSHILKPSHAGQLIPRARRQVTYETPHLQGPVPSESPANHGKTRASQRFSICLIFSNCPTFSNCLTPDGSYPVRAANSPTKLPTCKVLNPVDHLQNLRKIRASRRFSITPIFSNRLTPHGSCPVRVARSPTKLPTCKVLYAVHRPQNLRKIRASQRFSNCLIFSNRLTPHGSCPVRAARSPTKLPTCKVLYAVHRPQNLRKIRASRRFSNCLIFSNRLTRARPPSPPTPQIILR